MYGLVDYHTHSVFSDGKDTYEKTVESAIEKGLSEIGFSDHICLKYPDWAIAEADFAVMASHVEEIKKKYGHLISVKFGIEMDYFPGKEKELARIIGQLPLDYVIGSVHFIGDWNFDSEKSLSLYGKWSNDEVYRMYFELIQQAARSRLFDIIGHLDIVKKFRIYPETPQDLLFHETIKTIKEAGCVVEVNTGGLDRPCAEFNPGAHLLQMCCKMEIPVTLSSDAHHPAQVARHFSQAVDLLKETGYTGIVSFDKRKRRILTI